MNRRFLLASAAALALPGCAQLRTWVDGIDVQPDDVKRIMRGLTNAVRAGAGFIRARLDAAGQAAFDKALPELQDANDRVQGADTGAAGWRAYVLPAVVVALGVLALVVPVIGPAIGLSAAAVAGIGAGIVVLQSFVDQKAVAPDVLQAAHATAAAALAP